MSFIRSSLSPIQQQIREAQRKNLRRYFRRWLIVTTLFATIFLWGTSSKNDKNHSSSISPSSTSISPSSSTLLHTSPRASFSTEHVYNSRGGKNGDWLVLRQTMLGGVATSDNSKQSNDKQENTLESPSLYGWTPRGYPNPLNNFIRCGIAYINEQHFSLTAAMTTRLQWNDTNSQQTNDSYALGHYNQSTLEDGEEPLRLCDPDWCLGGVLLEEIAEQLRNFSKMFRDYYVQHPYGNKKHHWRAPEMQTLPSPETNSKSQGGIKLAVAIVRKMNLPALLRQRSYYAYEDQEDMIDDAVQTFCRALHDEWFNDNSGIIILVSVQDRVCCITAGLNTISVLPWWRLDQICVTMRAYLRQGNYGQAVLKAIELVSDMLVSGPPTFSERMYDFFTRFGVVIAFSIFTFSFGAWGEYRDRRRRWQFAHYRSKLSELDREKASLLQLEFRTPACPICLEKFSYGEESSTTVERGESEDDKSCLFDVPSRGQKGFLDHYGLPTRGPDGRRLKLLRCGHIFCETCWQSWVHSGCGNPCNCPVCRQDIGKNPRKQPRRYQSTSQYQSTSLETGQMQYSDDSLPQSQNAITFASSQRVLDRDTMTSPVESTSLLRSP